MKPKLFDIHCHLNFPDFDKDRNEVIKRALDNGIWMINVGSDFENSKKAVEIAEKYKEGVYASVGVHPTDIGNGFDKEAFKNLAKHPKVVAIGECGLDYYRNREIRSTKSLPADASHQAMQAGEIRNKQKEIFIKQIDLAVELNKPLMIHCRDARPLTPERSDGGRAHKEVLEILSGYRHSHGHSNLRGNVHFFSGNFEQAKKYFDLGFSISFTGVLTYDVGRINDIVSQAPLDKIMIETDAPFARPLTPERSDGGRVAPVPFREKRNEPFYVKEVAKKIAQIRNEPYKKIAQITTENALKLFNL